MNSDLILKNLPVSVYIGKYKITGDKFEIIDFETVKHMGNSDYKKDELNPDIILKSLVDSDEIKEFINLSKKCVENDVFSITYHFKDKQGRIVYFKDYIKILSVKDNIYTVLGVNTEISNETQLSQIFESILKSPLIAILIYKDKVLLANDTLKNILEIDDKIYELNPVELVPAQMKPILQNAVKRRVKGDKFSKLYAFELKTFKDKRIYAEFLTDTIFYQNGYAGLVMAIDKTESYKNKIMLKMLAAVNSLITNTDNENTLLENILNKLNEIAYFNEVRLNERLDSKEIEINNEFNDPNFKSYLYLPVVLDNKVIASYSFYSVYRDDFSEEIVSNLREIQKKILNALKNIKNKKNLIILSNAIDKSYQWLIITDEKGNILYVNEAVEEMSGYKKEELIGKNARIFKSNFHPKEFYKILWETILNDKIFTHIIVNKDKKGNLFYLKDKIIPVKIDDQRYFVSLGIDITKEKLLEKKLDSVKYKDFLTNLYNRCGFLFYGGKKLKSNKNFALLLIDIEDFKLLNEIKGFTYGDMILQKFAEFLRSIFYADDLIARLSNDDFAVLIEYENIKTLLKIINKIFDKLNENKDVLPINIKVGIALYPKDAKDIISIIEKAYIALSFQKKLKGYNFKFYNQDISFEIENYMKAKDLLNEALENKEFVYYYQPYVDSKNLKFYGAESLLRIKKENKIITPDFFIDYAEKSAKIKDIEILMMHQLVQTIKKTGFPLSFNLSGISFKDENHLKKLIKISQKYADSITIEITERELIEDLQISEKFFSLFKSRGYKIAIDDFGTGYSSLAYISNIPIDILKIDISFIRNMTKSKKDLAIVETIIDFAKKLNFKTIAEGVETQKEVEILQKLECDYLQGYYFSKPLPFDEFKKFITP